MERVSLFICPCPYLKLKLSLFKKFTGWQVFIYVIPLIFLQMDEALKIKNTDIAKELSLPPVKLHCSSEYLSFFGKNFPVSFSLCPIGLFTKRIRFLPLVFA